MSEPEPVLDVGAAHGIDCRAPRCPLLVRESDGSEVCRASIPRAFQPDRAVNAYYPSRLLPAPGFWCARHPSIRRLLRRLYQEEDDNP